jgi:hypothetical protein
VLVLRDAGVEDEEVDAVVARAERLRQVLDLVLLGLVELLHEHLVLVALGALQQLLWRGYGSISA